MPQTIKLSELAQEIDGLIREKFTGRTFWISAETSGVKKVQNLRRCYVDFFEKGENNSVLFKGVCWSKGYQSIELYEKITGQEFKSGINITCKVSVSFYKDKTHPQLEIIEIDCTYEIGKAELERREILNRLLKENPKTIRIINEKYVTKNNQLALPVAIQKVALITGPNSDGQRDFKTAVLGNAYKYDIFINEYLSQVQGTNASQHILNSLKSIAENKDFYDVVVICRGGGNDLDFTAFNDYELSKAVAIFPIPILTGIGHDRNTSIVDLMARQKMNPAQVGAFIIDRNMRFDSEIESLKERLFRKVEDIFDQANGDLEDYEQRIKNLNPVTILKKGFAIITVNDKIITNPKEITSKSSLKTILKDEIIHSTVTKKTKV